MKSTQSNRPNDKSVKMLSTRKTNQQPATSSEARSHISSMSPLRFNKGKLVGMAMLDNLAQRTEIRLTSPRYNKAIPAGDFRFNEASLSQ